MTSYEELVSQTAAKDLKALEQNLQSRIKEKVLELAEDPDNRSGKARLKETLSNKEKIL